MVRNLGRHILTLAIGFITLSGIPSLTVIGFGERRAALVLLLVYIDNSTYADIIESKGMGKIESEITSFLKARNWDKPLPGDIAKSICIEAAELLELFQWGVVSTSKLKANAKLFAQVRKELADVLIYGIVMTVSLGLDVHSVVDEKLRLVKKKYPARLMRSVPPAQNRLYRSIKEKHRRK